MGATGERVRVFGAEAITMRATGGPANDGEQSTAEQRDTRDDI